MLVWFALYYYFLYWAANTEIGAILIFLLPYICHLLMEDEVW